MALLALDEIYDRPATTFVARLVGTPRINLFAARREDSAVLIKNSPLRLPAPRSIDLPRDFLLGIRPEDVHPDPTGEFAGRLALTEPLGVETILTHPGRRAESGEPGAGHDPPENRR